LIDDVTPAAADFLKWLEAELENQEVLRPLYDSRALAQIAQNIEAIRALSCDITKGMLDLPAIESAILSFLHNLGLVDQVRANLSTDDKQIAFETALARAYTAFARNYPMWAASLFDEHFLTSKPVIELLATLLTPSGRPDPKEFARLFANHISQHYSEHRERLIDDVTPAAADFLKWLEAELENQEALRSLYDSRALEQIAKNIEAIRQLLEGNRNAASDSHSFWHGY
jgi:hypothetical protein